jgi:hypothetical protein
VIDLTASIGQQGATQGVIIATFIDGLGVDDSSLFKLVLMHQLVALCLESECLSGNVRLSGKPRCNVDVHVHVEVTTMTS